MLENLGLDFKYIPNGCYRLPSILESECYDIPDGYVSGCSTGV
jgi:hypothetical protein